MEPETMAEIVAVFNRQFGGFTPLGETRMPKGMAGAGTWVDPDTGDVVEDVCLVARVYVDEEDLKAFEQVAYAIGYRLEQKEILIDIGPATGIFLKMHDAEGEHDEEGEEPGQQGDENDKELRERLTVGP